MPLLVESFPRLRPFCSLGNSSGLRGSPCWLRLFLDWDSSAGWELHLVWKDPSVGWYFSLVEILLLLGNFVWFGRIPMWVETFHLLRPFWWLGNSSGLEGSLRWLRLFLGWDRSAGWELCLVWEDPYAGWDFSLIMTLPLVGNFVWFERIPMWVETFHWLRPFCWLGNSSGLEGFLWWLRLFLDWDPSAGGELRLVWEDPSVGWDFSLVETLLLVGKLVWFGRIPLLVETFPRLRRFC